MTAEQVWFWTGLGMGFMWGLHERMAGRMRWRGVLAYAALAGVASMLMYDLLTSPWQFTSGPQDHWG